MYIIYIKRYKNNVHIIIVLSLIIILILFLLYKINKLVN